MSRRAVYDAMVFVQWAALPAGRQHSTVQALYDRTIQLFMSDVHLAEIRDVLARPELRSKLPNLTPERVTRILNTTKELAVRISDVPNAFTWPHHPDDDHLFNLAIAAKAERLVTFENRILEIHKRFPGDAARLDALAPQLRIVTPKELSEELRSNERER